MKVKGLLIFIAGLTLVFFSFSALPTTAVGKPETKWPSSQKLPLEKIIVTPAEEDKTPPIVEAEYTPEEPHIDDEITFTGKASDASGVKNIAIFINGEAKRECISQCKKEDITAGRCFELEEGTLKSGEKEWRCTYTGGPYSVGTLIYKTEAIDNQENKGESEEKQIEIRVEIAMPPARMVGCFYSISGRVRYFSYDYETLKIKSCQVVPSYGTTLSMCSLGTEEYTDVSAENGRYTIENLCPNTYLIEPVYRAAEGKGKCQWRGSWDPEGNLVTVEDTNVVNQNFNFTPREENRPRVEIEFTSSESREGREISTGDRITFDVSAFDSYGIAKIQIFQKLDRGEGYGEQELVKECNISTFPAEVSCTFRGSHYSGVEIIEVEGVACDKNGNSSSNKRYVFLTEAHCLNGSRDADEENIDCGGADCEPCPLNCVDRIQNRDEEEVDCGGRWCPPCSQCTTEAKWSPHDTPCQHHWPTDDGPEITGNTTSDSCELYELCHPELDYVVKDALICCERPDFERRIYGYREDNREAACRYARGTSGIDADYNPVNFKKCLGLYAISGLGGSAVYMQGYFHGELCCPDNGDCPDGCPSWRVRPVAWEMGTAASCAGPEGERPDFMMGGHRCVYNKFGTIKWGKHGWWNSDTDWEENSDSLADIPAHASINLLSTGTCVDYSVALTTILRKLGYSKDEVFSVDGDEHWYNLVKFPGETKWNYVDTTGNRGGEIFGGLGFAEIYDSSGDLIAGYDYCQEMDDGCSNDYYEEDTDFCPPNNEIYSCEGIPR